MNPIPIPITNTISPPTPGLEPRVTIPLPSRGSKAAFTLHGNPKDPITGFGINVPMGQGLGIPLLLTLEQVSRPRLRLSCKRLMGNSTWLGLLNMPTRTILTISGSLQPVMEFIGPHLSVKK
jgi:hypothetical protein